MTDNRTCTGNFWNQTRKLERRISCTVTYAVLDLNHDIKRFPTINGTSQRSVAFEALPLRGFLKMWICTVPFNGINVA